MSELFYSPYWYLIKDTETGKFYTGSKFGKDSYPELFWKENGYTTSSREINEIIKKSGLQRFVVLRKVMREDAYDFETRFLRKVKASKNPLFYNQHENNGFASKPNTVVVKNSDGEKFRVHKEDPRYLSGELVGVAKGSNHKKKDNSNYKKPKKNKENYKGWVTVWSEEESKWIRIKTETYSKEEHITPTSKPKSKDHKRKIGESNKKPRAKISCLFCRKQMGINNLNQHQKGSNCDERRL